jgi:hypothetical protein
MNVKLDEMRELAYVFRDAVTQCKPFDEVVDTWGFRKGTTNSKNSICYHIIHLIALEDIVNRGVKRYRYVQCCYDNTQWPTCGSYRMRTKMPIPQSIMPVDSAWIKFIESLHNRLIWFQKNASANNCFVEVADFVEKEYNELKSMMLIH